MMAGSFAGLAVVLFGLLCGSTASAWLVVTAVNGRRRTVLNERVQALGVGAMERMTLVFDFYLQ